MSGGKKPSLKGRDIDRSDSGYTTQTDMESNAPSHGKLDDSSATPGHQYPAQGSAAKPTRSTTPININSGTYVRTPWHIILARKGDVAGLP